MRRGVRLRQLRKVFSFDAVMRWKRFGVSCYVPHSWSPRSGERGDLPIRRPLEGRALHQQALHETHAAEDNLDSEKFYPVGFPQRQVNNEEETFDHLPRVLYNAKDGDENCPLLRRLHCQFYVWLCCAMEQISTMGVEQIHTRMLAIALQDFISLARLQL